MEYKLSIGKSLYSIKKVKSPSDFKNIVYFFKFFGKKPKYIDVYKIGVSGEEGNFYFWLVVDVRKKDIVKKELIDKFVDDEYYELASLVSKI